MNCDMTLVGNNGLYATFYGKNKSASATAIRCDLDALPIQEVDSPGMSTVPGVMHACGHDAHTAVLLGFARVLQQYEDELPYPVTLIFQPHEEVVPGGAIGMIASGSLDNPYVDKILGLHVDPKLNIGQIGLKSGPFYAACDCLDILVSGQAIHVARSMDLFDPVVETAEVIKFLTKDNCHDFLVKIGLLTGGVVRNVLPEGVKLQGSIRSVDGRRELFIKELDNFVSNHPRVSYSLIGGYPPLVNDVELTDEVISGLTDSFDCIVQDRPLLISEDFAYYAQKRPGTFINLGIGNSDVELHSNNFRVSPEAIELGVRLWTTIIFK